MNDPADDVGFGDLFCQQFYYAIVDEDPVAGADVMGQTFEGYAALLGVAEDIPGGEGIGISVLDLDRFIVLELSQSHLRSLGVQHGGDGQTQLVPQAADHVEAALLRFVISVGKVEAGNVHAALHQIPQHVDRIRCGSYRADNFGFSHI